jgi:hypothetical protein
MISKLTLVFFLEELLVHLKSSALIWQKSLLLDEGLELGPDVVVRRLRGQRRGAASEVQRVLGRDLNNVVG